MPTNNKDVRGKCPDCGVLFPALQIGKKCPHCKGKIVEDASLSPSPSPICRCVTCPNCKGRGCSLCSDGILVSMTCPYHGSLS